MTTIKDIIQNHIVGEIFCEFPDDLNTNPFDFFIMANVDSSQGVDNTPLATEWGYVVCQQYELDNVRYLRGLMQSMYNDLEKLKSKLFQHTSHTIQINKDEVESESAFNDIAQYPNAIHHRQGTSDEFVSFITVSTEALS